MSGEDQGWPPSPLWDHAVALYARPGVREACLTLQDGRGADVNLLLLACWLGAGGRRLGPDGLTRLRTQGEAWQAELVRPLRAARRTLKRRLPETDAALRQPLLATRERLAAVELALERAELLGLELAVAKEPAEQAAPGPQVAAEALRHLAPLRSGDRDQLAVLLRAAFPAADKSELRQALEEEGRGSAAAAW